MNTFCELEEVYGDINQAFEDLQNRKIKAIRALIYSAIKVENENVTLKEVGQMLTLSDMEKLGTAINDSPAGINAGGRRKYGGIESHTESRKWDWEWLFYLGTNLLRMTEEKFWKSTPKKLQALFKIYKTVNGIEDNEDFDTIDNINF